MKCIRKIKQIFALLLAAVMMVAMAVPAMADETETGTTAATYSITITNAAGTYKAYQVFTGDLAQDNDLTILSNIAWGDGVEEFEYEGTADAKKIAAYLTEKDDTEAKKFAKAAAARIIPDKCKKETKADKGVATLDELPAGYYVILNSEVGATESASSIILQVTADQRVANKAEVPSFEKKLKDINDTTGITSDWQDSADYDIGDNVPFKLEGTVASNYADYKGAYKFIFHDKEEAGLSFDSNSVKVYVDDNLITNTDDKTYYQVKTPGVCDEKCTFEVVFADLKKIDSVQAGSKIRVEYESKLNDQAVFGNQGNVNKARLEFSNDPNAKQGKETTGKTPWDNVIVFTYQIVVNKYANTVAEENRLAGAEFTLQKKLKDDSTKDIAVVKSEDGKVFTFKGLDDGVYVLTETKAPDKYNKIDPVTFTVNANHTITWEATADRTGILTNLTGEKTNGEITLTANNDKSELSTDIINKSGTTLPSTGGIGTRIFYVVGGILMAGAAVLLIVKKRMSKED